jgi:acetyltransferase-like isoleucine patch superfamily enzyme
MLHHVLNKLIRLKNPHFRLHHELGTAVLCQLLITKAVAWIRARKLIFKGKKPGFLFLGKSVSFFNPANMKFGRWVQLEDFVYLSALGKRPVILGNNVRIGAFSRVVCSTNFAAPGDGIFIGDNVGIGEFSYLGGAGGLRIGKDCIIGQYFSCHPENHNFGQSQLPVRLQGVSRKGITIGENCWIGAKVTILDGVRIGDNCVIAAGAVVTKDVAPHSVVAGVPAKVIKTIVNPENQKSCQLEGAF